MTRRYKVVLRREATAQLQALYRYVAEHSGDGRARAFTDEILAFCRSLDTFPEHGTARDDIRPSLQVVGFRRTVAIALGVRENRVTILAILYGGRDLESALRTIPDQRRRPGFRSGAGWATIPASQQRRSSR